MRRAFLAITGLAAGTTALVVLKGSPGTGPQAQELPVDQVAALPGGSAPATPGAAPEPTASATAAAPRPSRGTAPARMPGTRTGTSARPTTAAPRPTTAAPRTTTTRTVTGPVVSNEYGNVQVQITVSGTRIVNAVALELPDGGQSTLRSDRVDGTYSGSSGQVVQRQSADLDTISGATATSTSYLRSLQAAIDQAR